MTSSWTYNMHVQSVSKKSRKLMTFIISYFMSIVSTSIRENLKFQCIEIKQTKKKAEKRTNFFPFSTEICVSSFCNSNVYFISWYPAFFWFDNAVAPPYYNCFVPIVFTRLFALRYVRRKRRFHVYEIPDLSELYGVCFKLIC